MTAKGIRIIKIALFLYCLLHYSIINAHPIHNLSETTPIFKKLQIKKVSKEEFKVKMIAAYNKLKTTGEEKQLKEIVSLSKKSSITFNDIELNCILKYIEAHTCFNTFEHSRAKLLYEGILKHKKNIKDKELILLTNNDLGILHKYESDVNASRYYYFEALKYVDEEKHPVTAIDLYYNLTMEWQRSNEWRKSYEVALKCISLIEKTNVKKNRIKYLYANAGYTLFKLKRYEEAEKFLLKSIEYSKKKSHRGMMIAQEKLALVYDALGEKDKVIIALKKSIDSYKKEHKYQIKKQNKLLWEKETLNTKIDKEKYYNLLIHKWLLYFCLLLLLTCTLLGIRYYKLLIKQKNNFKCINVLNAKLKDSLSQIEKSYQDISVKNSEVTELLLLNEKSLFTKELRISTYNDSLQNITKKVTEMIESDSPITHNNLLPIEKKLKMLIDENSIWEDFKIQFEKIRPNFFKKLKRYQPDLSVNDMKHCAYIISRLRTKDVASLLNISPRSVETVRYRLRKKLSLDKETSLYNFLQNL